MAILDRGEVRRRSCDGASPYLSATSAEVDAKANLTSGTIYRLQ